MAIFSIDIPDDAVDRVLGAVVVNYGWQVEIENPEFNEEEEENDSNLRMIPNPESQSVFANRIVREFLINNVKSAEAKVAAEIARTAAIEAVDINIIDAS